MTLKELITDLCGLYAPSGFEDAAFARIAEHLRPFVDEIHTDAMGNLIAIKKCGKPGAKKLMLDAHMDEIGLIVTDIDKTGFLRFGKLGGIDPRMLPARELMVLSDPPIFGVIDTLPPHALEASDFDKTIDEKKLCIDVGLTADEARERIPLGTPCVFAESCKNLGENMLCSKSLDDRACGAIIIKVMEKISSDKLFADIYCLISTQEELGMRGAVTGAYAVNPDYAIAIDVTHAATPDSKKGETMEMRKGAAIGVGPNMSRNITGTLFDISKEKGIACQTEVMGGSSGTNGWVIQVSREGVSTAVVSLPLKYMHTPVETVDLADAQAIVSLVSEYARVCGRED